MSAFRVGSATRLTSALPIENEYDCPRLNYCTQHHCLSFLLPSTLSHCSHIDDNVDTSLSTLAIVLIVLVPVPVSISFSVSVSDLVPITVGNTIPVHVAAHVTVPVPVATTTTTPITNTTDRPLCPNRGSWPPSGRRTSRALGAVPHGTPVLPTTVSGENSPRDLR